MLLLFAGCAENPSQGKPDESKVDGELEELLSLSETDGFVINMEVEQRNRLLGLPAEVDAEGDIARFEGLDQSTLEKLLRHSWADPRDRQNNAPSIAEFYRFMRRWPEVKAQGYAVSSLREDYRVTLEGIYVQPDDVSPELKKEFLEFAEGADELVVRHGLSAWWD